MKKNLFVIIGVGLLSLSLTSFSQSQLKIGHVNFEKIMSALLETDTAKAILDKESKEFRAAYEDLTVAYNQLYDEYQKGLSSYTAIAKKT
jgi:Skp family chaperone for outer membrane proteins